MKKFIETTFTKDNGKKLLVAGVAVTATVLAVIFIPKADVTANTSEQEETTENAN